MKWKMKTGRNTYVVYTHWDLIGFLLTAVGVTVIFVLLWVFFYSVLMLTVGQVFG